MIATIATVCLAASAAANPVATQGLGESCDMALYCKQGLQCTTGLFGTDGTCIDKDSAAINLRKLGSSFGSLPPAYLSVPNVRDCLGSQFVGTSSIVCIPKTMPAACDAASWGQLKDNAGLQACAPEPTSSMRGLRAMGCWKGPACTTTNVGYKHAGNWEQYNSNCWDSQQKCNNHNRNNDQRLCYANRGGMCVPLQRRPDGMCYITKRQCNDSLSPTQQSFCYQNEGGMCIRRIQLYGSSGKCYDTKWQCQNSRSPSQWPISPDRQCRRCLDQFRSNPILSFLSRKCQKCIGNLNSPGIGNRAYPGISISAYRE